MQPQYFVGVDPGINVIGIACIDASGKTKFVAEIKDESRAKKGRLDPSRLAAICRRAQQAINAMNLGSFVVYGLEEPFAFRGIGRNGKPVGNSHSIKTYGVFSVLAAALEERLESGTALDLIIIPPMSLKKFVGYKEKALIAKQVFKRWGFEHTSLDVIDAYAMAHYAKDKWGADNG